MKVTTTTASEIIAINHRLDASYHSSEGVQALRFIRRWTDRSPRTLTDEYVLKDEKTLYRTHKTDVLSKLCIGAGIFIGGRARRIYVQDPEHGIPFLSSSDMLLASFKGVNLISNKQPGLKEMLLEKGSTLISRSGTIGNVVYVRDDMVGLAASEHIMRVVPDPNKIPPGYLFAFLSSPLGKEIIKSGTYGSVVDTISTEFVGNIPIPRLDTTTEVRIHELVEGASSLWTQSRNEIEELVEQFDHEVLGIPYDYKSKWPNERSFATSAVNLKGSGRLDAFHHTGHAMEYYPFLKEGPILKNLATIHLPGPFKRMYVDESGIPYLSGVDVYQIRIVPRLWLSPRQPEIKELTLSKPGSILVQTDGQRYGLIGRPVYADKSVIGAAVSNHLVRIAPNDLDVGCYVYLFLSTEAGRRELIRHSYGTSIPTIPKGVFEHLIIPKAQTEQARSMGKSASRAFKKRAQANQLEDKAQNLLLEAIGWSGI